MKRILGSINSLHIIMFIMIGLILAALMARHFSDTAKGTEITHTSPATAITSPGR